MTSIWWKDDLVYLEFEAEGYVIGRVNFQLNVEEYPDVCENFIALCTGSKGVGANGDPLYYKGSRIHHYSDKVICGGDIILGTGRGGEGAKEMSFHNKFYGEYIEKYSLSMIRSPNLLPTSQFLIALDDLMEIDEKPVVFGRIVGHDTVLEYVRDQLSYVDRKPELVISDCGKCTFPSMEEMRDRDDIKMDEVLFAALPYESIHKLLSAIRESGSQLFREGNYQLAKKRYDKVIKYLDMYEPYDLSPEDDQALTDFKVSSCLNSSLVSLKLNDHKNAMEMAREALTFPNASTESKAKAYSRLGSAYLLAKDEEQAIVNLEMALQLCPNDKGITAVLKAAQKAQIERKNRQKAALSKFFDNA